MATSILEFPACPAADLVSETASPIATGRPKVTKLRSGRRAELLRETRSIRGSLHEEGCAGPDGHRGTQRLQRGEAISSRRPSAVRQSEPGMAAAGTRARASMRSASFRSRGAGP
jgi:hypothetical protein